VKVSKERFKSRGQLQVLLREVHVLAHLSAGSEISQHIVRYHQAWVEDERLFIAMELCEQNLEDQLVAGLQMPFVEVLSFLRQMVLALEVN
jgi:serine/threonine protein kinase